MISYFATNHIFASIGMWEKNAQPMTTVRFRRGSFVCLLVLLTTLPLLGQQGARNGEWRAWGGDGGTSRYSPLAQINRDNVRNLRIAWTWSSDGVGGAAEARSETTPLMANGRLFFTAGRDRAVVAADAGTGETLWQWTNDEGERNEKAPRKGSGRGVGYWTDGRDERVFTITPGFRLVALDARTGRQVSGFGQEGVVDLFKELDPTADLTGTIGNSSPPVISGDTVIVGPALAQSARPMSYRNTKGNILAFDARTGSKRWDFRTIPRKGEQGYETWLNGSAEYTGNAGAWTPFTVDDELGYVYLPVEAPTSEYLRRPPPRQQPVLIESRLRRYQDGQARLALPARTPRHLGLRHRLAADPRRHHQQRQAHQGGRAADEAVVSRTSSIASRASRCGRSRSGRFRRTA